MPLLIDPSPCGARSVLNPFEEVALVDRNPPDAVQRPQTELESVYSREVAIMKTTASSILRVIGRDVEKRILIDVAHRWSFALPVLLRVLNDAKRINPQPSD